MDIAPSRERENPHSNNHENDAPAREFDAWTIAG